MEVGKGEDDIQVSPLLIQQLPEPGHSVPMLYAVRPTHLFRPTAVAETPQRLHVYIGMPAPKNVPTA